MKLPLFCWSQICLGVFALLSLPVSLSAQQASPAVADEAPLQAQLNVSPVRLSPESTLELVFPTVMVSSDRVGQAEAESPLVAEPALKGVFEWTSTRSGVFKLLQVPRFSQKYEFKLRAGWRDAAGRALGTEVLETVNTAGFQVVDQDPKWFSQTDVPRTRAFLFQFNDQVNALDAAAHVSFRSVNPEQVVGVKVRHAVAEDFNQTWSPPQPTWTEQISQVEVKLAAGEKRLSALVVEPVEPLPVAGKWELVLAGSLTNSSGQSKLGGEQWVAVGSVLAMKVSEVTAHTPFDRSYHIDVRFNKSLPVGPSEETVEARAARLEALAAHVVIEPEVAVTEVEVLEDRLRLKGGFALGMPYRVTVVPGIAAADGLMMEGAAVEKEVTFVPNPPYLGAPAFARSQQAKGEGVFEISAANVKTVRVRAKRLTGPQLVEAMEKYRGYEAAFERDLKKRRAHKVQPIESYPGEWVLDREFTIDKPLDQSEVIGLKWAELLKMGDGAGAVFLEMEGVASDPSLSDSKVITQSLLEVTDLGLVHKSSGRDQLVFITGLESGQPVGEVRVTLLDGERRLIGQSETDGNGVAQITSAAAAYVLAEQANGDCAVLDLKGRDSELWGIYGYSIHRGWRDVWLPQRVTFVFSDRSLYRPGDTVHVKAITRLQTGDSLSLEGRERSARLLLRDAQYRLIRDEAITFSANGSFTTDLVLPEGPLGSYDLSIQFSDEGGVADAEEEESGGGTGFLYFRVDDYRPNTFEVTLDAAAVKVEADRLQVPLVARYYMGKPLSQADISWHAYSEPGFTPAAEYADYRFGDAPSWAGYGDGELASDDRGEEAESSDWFVNGDVKLSADGTAVLPLPRPPPTRSAMPQRVSIYAELTDLNQQTITTSTTLEVPGARIVPGIREGEGFARAGQATEVQLIALAGNGQPLAVATAAEVVVERQAYQTVRVEVAGRGTTTETRTVLHEEVRQTVELRPVAGAKTTASHRFAFTPQQSGNYFVTVTTTDADGVKAFARWPLYVIGKGGYPWMVEDGVKLTLQPEKTTVKPGGEAVIAIQCPIEGTALITVERNRLHQHLVQPFTFADPVVRIPIGESDAPNIYVSVVVVRGAAASGKKLAMPEYRAGYTEIQVPSDALALKVAVEPAQAEVLPGSELAVRVRVTDARGAPQPGADVALFAVDEGVLSLTQHETPKPEAFFHQPFPLTFSNYASFENLLSEVREERVRSNKGFLVGGGGEDGEVPPQVRKNFVATPLWLANGLTDELGTLNAKVAVPDNLTRYRLMSVVTAGAERFGHGESAFTVNKPLMVEPVVPRFARLGDEVLIKAVVHNTTPTAREIEVTLELDQGAGFITESRPFSAGIEAGADGKGQLRKVRVEAGATVSTAFPVKFSEVGSTTWRWMAKTVDAGVALSDATETTFQVEHPVPELREVRYTQIEPAAVAAGQAAAAPQAAAGPRNLLAAVSPVLLEGQGRVNVSVSTTRLTEVRDALDYLLRYPYGCAEQTTSATLPWLALGGFHQLFPEQLSADRSREAVQRGVNRLLQMVVQGEGGLAYWPGGGESNRWASAYGGLMLLRAREAGAQVPGAVVDELMEYLSKSLRGLDTATDAYLVADAALALYTLAKAKRPEPAYHTLLFERRERLPEVAKLYLGLAMLISETPHAQVKTLLGWVPPNQDKPAAPAAVPAARPAAAFDHWAGRGVNDALRLLIYTHMGLNADAAALSQRLWAARNATGEWGNTYANAWTLTALTAYERSRKTTGQPLEATLAWGEETQPVQLSVERPLADWTFQNTPLRANQPLHLTVPAEASAWVRTEVRSHPQKREFAGENHGFGITRDYRKVMPDGSTAPAEDLRVGDLIRVSLGIEMEAGGLYLAIEDALPSVLEPVNPAFESLNARQGGPFDDYERWFCDHRELRADRALFFTDNAPERGRFVLHYLARVIAEGDTIAPPAKIEAMYEPSKYGLSPTHRLITLPSSVAKVAGK
jgi:alpha-2-macroglobulin